MSWRALASAARTGASQVLSNRAGLVAIAFFQLIVTLVLAALWRAAAGANGGELAGYSATALVWYAATSEAATVSAPPRLIEQAGDDIASERIAVELTRPLPAVLLRIAVELGRMAPRLLVCIVIGWTFALIYGGRPPSAGALLLALPSLCLGVALNVVAQHAFASAGFWLRETRSAWFIYQKLIFVLGGMLIPLELLPSWMERVARLLPFASMAYAPARIASGHVELDLVAVQLLWFAGVGAVSLAAFSLGERKLVASS